MPNNYVIVTSRYPNVNTCVAVEVLRHVISNFNTESRQTHIYIVTETSRNDIRFPYTVTDKMIQVKSMIKQLSLLIRVGLLVFFICRCKISNHYTVK